MIARAVRPTDAEAVSGLLLQLGYALPADRIADKLARLEANPSDAVFVAEVGNRIVGCIGAHAHELLHVEGRLGRITALIVDEDARHRGVGTALLSAAERFLEAAGCVKIELTSADRRCVAHQFYEARGFRIDERRFLKVMGTTARRRD